MTLKQRLNQKLKKNGGFTLIEMLIVVAIIAILVVVSIPMVGSSLDNAKTQTDAANLRAAKAAGTIEYLTNDGFTSGNYDAADGTITSETPSPGYGQSNAHKGDYIVVSVEADGTVTAKWSKDK